MSVSRSDIRTVVHEARADLHVHSRYSTQPASLGIERFLSPTSRTEPEEVYRRAKRRGMDFVTLTDRDTLEGALRLVEAHPSDCFTGLETSAVFPEDGCKVNLLVWGLDSRQFGEIQRLRKDIYELAAYLRSADLAHAVAHASRSVNGRLNLSKLERLVLLFDVFEGANGTQGRMHNRTLVQCLRELTPEKIDEYQRKHGLQSLSAEPWKKSFTGGSDDLSGLMIGTSRTTVAARTKDEFLLGVRTGRSLASGRDADFRSAAFTAYKLAYDQLRETKAWDPATLFLSQIGQWTFESESLGLLDRIKMRTMNAGTKLRSDRTASLVLELAESCGSLPSDDVDGRIDAAFSSLCRLVDEVSGQLVRGFTDAVERGEVIRQIKDASASVSAILLVAPLFGALRNLYRDREVLRDLKESLGRPRSRRGKRILWFSDTLGEVNGPSVTLRQIANLSHERGNAIGIVGTVDGEGGELPPNVIRLPWVGGFRVPYYDVYEMRVPSLLRSLETLADYAPDEIYVSTPGPVGCVGLALGKLLGVRTTGVYHTDFLQQAADIVPDDAVLRGLEDFIQLFYSAFDEIAVPTSEYIGILSARGYDPTKMRLFQRGIDTNHFAPREVTVDHLERSFGVPPGKRLLYVGRISKDKRLGFLLDVFARLREHHPDLSLVLTGSGPYREELERRNEPGVFFLGRQDVLSLPAIYSASDLFVFPSLTDTFGMAVLESMACGLPVLVSDVGGPKELVRDGETGWIVGESTVESWMHEIEAVLDMMERRPAVYAAFRERSRQHVLERFDWHAVLDSYVEGASLATDEDAPDDLGGPVESPFHGGAARGRDLSRGPGDGYSDIDPGPDGSESAVPVLSGAHPL